MTHLVRETSPSTRVNVSVWGPVGKLARQNAAGEQVKRAGPHLMGGQSRLDRTVHEFAPANQLRNRHSMEVVRLTTVMNDSQLEDLEPGVNKQRTSPQEAAAPRSACVALDLKERVTQ